MGSIPLAKAGKDALEFATLALNKARYVVYFVTIDDTPDKDHAANFNQVKAFADRYKGTKLVVKQVHLDKIDAVLADPTTFALFLAGSWPEWLEAKTNVAWSAQLDHLCKQIVKTKIPILAVCGSHQLVSVAFAGWESLTHMAEESKLKVPPKLSDEHAAEISLIPKPRLSEVGTYPFTPTTVAASDPIFKGMTPPYVFMLHHCDQVSVSGRSADFYSLVEPTNTVPAHVSIEKKYQFVNLPLKDRCQIQALRLNKSDRILYTTQFHPELPCFKVSWECFGDTGINYETVPTYMKADTDGEKLIHNFFNIAADFWKAKP